MKGILNPPPTGNPYIQYPPPPIKPPHKKTTSFMHTSLIHKIQLFYSSKYTELNLLKWKNLTLSYCNQPSLISLGFPLFVVHQPYRLWHSVSDSWQVMISAKVFFFLSQTVTECKSEKKGQCLQHWYKTFFVQSSFKRTHKFFLEENKLCNLAIIVVDYKWLTLVKLLCELGLIWRKKRQSGLQVYRK